MEILSYLLATICMLVQSYYHVLLPAKNSLQWILSIYFRIACCWLLAAATAGCCWLQLAAAGFPSRRIIVPQIAIWLGWAQTHIPCARISSSQPTTSTPQLQHSPPAITGSSAFPPFPTRFAPLHGGIPLMFYFFSNGQFCIGYEYQFLVWTSWFDLPCHPRIWYVSAKGCKILENYYNSRRLLFPA